MSDSPPEPLINNVINKVILLYHSLIKHRVIPRLIIAGVELGSQAAGVYYDFVQCHECLTLGYRRTQSWLNNSGGPEPLQVLYWIPNYLFQPLRIFRDIWPRYFDFLQKTRPEQIAGLIFFDTVDASLTLSLV